MHSIVVSYPADPLRATSPLLWLRADSGVTGSPVSAWASRIVGGGSVTQSTGVNQPGAPAACSRLKNQLALVHDSTDRLFGDTDVNLSSAWTFFSAFDVDALKNEHGLFRVAASESSGGGGICIYAVSDGRLVVASANTSWYRVATSGITANTAHVILASCDGTSGGIVIEVGTIGGGSITWSTLSLGALSGTFAMPAASGDRLVCGGGWSSAGSFFAGRRAEDALWSRVLSAAEKSLVREYAATRYA